jgi:hypothetical protein
LTALQPLHVRPEQPVFVTTRGTPIEPKTFSAHWHDGLRACGIRQRGLYTTKDTNVTTALSDVGVTPAWIEQQTGVAYTTLRKHYGKILPSHVTRPARALRDGRADPVSHPVGWPKCYPKPGFG